MPPRKIFVIGASAGGIEAVSKLLRPLPASFAGSILIVIHLPSQGKSVLPEIFSRATPLPVSQAQHLEAIEAGKIYVAPPDYHLLVQGHYTELSKGAKVNNARPAIDNLFISAALAYEQDVVGVVLSGSLDDGSLGLGKIKRHGGIAIVQDPNEASYPDMPLNAIAKAKCDYVLKLSEISEMLIKLAAESVEQQGSDMNEQEFDKESNLEKSPQSHNHAHGEYAYEKGKPSVYSCPDCGGVLAEINDDGIVRFVCRVGHAYSEEWLAALQSEHVEKALWSALRALEEGASFAEHMATRAEKWTEPYLEKAKDYEKQAAVLRSLLLN